MRAQPAASSTAAETGDPVIELPRPLERRTVLTRLPFYGSFWPRPNAALGPVLASVTLVVRDMAPGDSFRVEVECYAGYRGEETPRRFRVGGRPVEVAEILDRWLDPDHRYFKLRGDDGDLYILRHDVATGAWEMTLYRSR